MDEAKRRLQFRDRLNTNIDVDRIFVDPAPVGKTGNGEDMRVASFFDPNSVTYRLSHEETKHLLEWLGEKITAKMPKIPQLMTDARRVVPKGEFEAHIVSQNDSKEHRRIFWFIIRRKGSQPIQLPLP
jgi:hypothetical protein